MKSMIERALVVKWKIHVFEGNEEDHAIHKKEWKSDK